MDRTSGVLEEGIGVKATAAPEMLQVHRGDHLAGLFLLMALVLAINISK